MKKILVLFLMLTAIAVSKASAQDQPKKTLYSFGIGISNENNIGRYGVTITNELKHDLIEDRLALHPRLKYFQSIDEVEDFDDYNSCSALFFDLGLNIKLLKSSHSSLAINIGPSYQFGNETHLLAKTITFTNGQEQVSDVVYENNKLRDFGFYADLEFSWTKKKTHSISLSSRGYDGYYPYYLGLSYTIGLLKF